MLCLQLLGCKRTEVYIHSGEHACRTTVLYQEISLCPQKALLPFPKVGNADPSYRTAEKSLFQPAIRL